MSAPDASFRDAFPFKGFTASAVPTRFVDRLSDEELIELNHLLHWNSFTADGNGRRFGNAPRTGKRDHPQPIPDRRIERMDEHFHLADKHVLEIGCFEGIHTVALCLRSKQVTAVDARIENVVKTIVRCAMFGHSPLVFRCNVEEPSANEELRMHVGKTTSAANYWSQGMSSSTRVLEVFGTAPQKPILDWGCGSGRTLRWLVCHEGWRHHYHGCDVDRAAIDWLRGVCRLNLEVCRDDPPLPYGDGFFGGLYAFSVLTHIHPDRHRSWYSELRRVMEPGGIAYLTTLGRSTVTESRKGVHGPIDEAFAKHGFVYLKNEGHYKDAAIVSEEFTRRMLDGLFTIEEYVERGYANMDAFRIRRLG